MKAETAPKIATREAYGRALITLGETRDDVIVLDADLSGSTKTKDFSKAFPERFFNMGVAEANMMGTAAGLAAMGKTVFASSFAMFAAGKAWEQTRQSICVPNLPVKICATHAGLTVGEDGKSHQMLEDITLMRVLPNMTVVVPADATEAEQVVAAVANTSGPVYVRLSRGATPVLFDSSYKFELGKGCVLREGNDIALVCTGVEVSACLEAAELLAARGINARVVNIATIKPIDEELITLCARECGAILTAEEHQVKGGLGSAVAEVVVQHAPVLMDFVGLQGQFGQSGTGTELLEHYGLDPRSITERATKLFERKA